jgi:hypothetical protein
MAEKYLRDLVIGFDKYCSIDTRTAAKKASVEQIRPSLHALIKVPINPIAEMVKHNIVNHRAVIPLIVANRSNRI